MKKQPFKPDTLENQTFDIVMDEASILLKRDGGYKPGFVFRVKSAALDKLAKIHQDRKTEHVVAVNAAWIEFSKRTKGKSTPPRTKPRLKMVG